MREKYILYITIINLYELVRGDVLAGYEGKKSKEDYEKVFYILPLDNNSIIVASRIWSGLRKKGELLDERDLLIGAICISNELPLATLNKKHFKRLEEYGLRIIDLI